MPSPLGDRHVGIARLAAALNKARHVQRREAVALLDLGDLRVGIRRQITNDDRNVRQSGLPCGPQTLGAEVDQVATIAISGVHDDGLQDAVLAEIFSQLIKIGFGKFSAWVVAVFV